MKKFFLLLSFIFLLLTSYAQDYRKIDSLKNILKTLPEMNGTDADTARMKVYLDLSQNFNKMTLDSSLFWTWKVVDTLINDTSIKNNPGKNLWNTKAILNLIDIYTKKNQYAIAINLCNKAIWISEKLNTPISLIASYNKYGKIFYYIGSLTNAITYWEKGLDISKKINSKKNISINLTNLGVAYSEIGNYYKTIDYWEQSRKIDEQLNDNQGRAICLRNLADLYATQSNFPKANQYCQESYQIEKSNSNLEGMAQCLIILGNIKYYQGDLPKSLDYYEKALEYKKILSDNRGISRCINNIGNVYKLQNNNKKASVLYQQALELSEKTKDIKNVSNCLMNIGQIFLEAKDYNLAIEYYKKALEKKESIDDNSGKANCLINLGIVYLSKNDFSNALDNFNKALAIKDSLCEKMGIAFCKSQIGLIYYKQGDYINASAIIKEAIEINKNAGILNNLINNYVQLGSVYFKQKSDNLSNRFFIMAMDLQIKMLKENFTILSENEKEAYIKKILTIKNDYNLLGIKNQSDSNLIKNYNYEIFIKGLLLNTTKGITEAVWQSNDTSLIKIYFLLKQIRQTIYEFQNKTLGIENKRIIDSLENLANQHERELVKVSSQHINSQNQYSIQWQHVQKNLKMNEAAIELVKINHTLTRPDTCTTDSFSYAALILKPGMPHPEMIPLCDEISLNKITGTIGWSDPTLVKMIYQKGSRKGLRLYEKIWQRMEPYLKDVKTIYIAPTGVLHQIAFNAIPCPDSTLLCDRFNINMVSSTRILADSAVQEPMFVSRNNKVAVFGGIQYDEDTTLIASLSQYHKTSSQQLAMRFKESNATRSSVMPWQYLYGSMQEAKTINNLLQQEKIKSALYSGSNALEEYFKQLEQQPSPDIIHIATHGFSFPLPDKQNAYKIFENSFVQNFNPLFRSGLLFAGANRTWANASRIDSIEDGVLTAYEVSNMNLQNTKLVVLSACETGLGDIKGSEGVYGLQRAFKMAGVKYIIMSLWPVPDKETQELMVTYYKKLIVTKNIRKAFEAAQNEMKKKYEPYYWAGFVLIE